MEVTSCVVFFFFQAEDGIRDIGVDWSSDVCSSDLDLTFLVPDSLGLGRIPDKIEAGTDTMYGEGTHTPDFQSSYVYGLAGEAVLNFGPAGAVVAFLPFGLLVRVSASFYRRCRTSPDAPGIALLAPGISLGTALFLTSDIDNVTWFFLNYLFYGSVLAVGSRWRPTTATPTRRPGSQWSTGVL